MNVDTTLETRLRLAVALFTGNVAALTADVERGIYDAYQRRQVFIPQTRGFVAEAIPEDFYDVEPTIVDLHPIYVWLGGQQYAMWHDPASNTLYYDTGRRDAYDAGDSQVTIHA